VIILFGVNEKQPYMNSMSKGNPSNVIGLDRSKEFHDVSSDDHLVFIQNVSMLLVFLVFWIFSLVDIFMILKWWSSKYY